MLGEHKLLIVILTVSFAAVALFLDSIVPRRYVVTATLRLQSPAEEAPLFGTRAPIPTVSEGEALALARDPRVVKRALDKAGPELVGRLSGNTNLRPSIGFRVIAVSGATEDPARAARLVDIYAAEVAEEIRRAEVRRIDQLIARLERARRPDRKGDAVRALENYRADQRLQQLRVIRRIARPAQLLAPAKIPSERQFGVAAHVPGVALFGFCLAIVFAFLIDLVTRRPRDVNRLTELAGLPVAGAIPRLRGDTRGSAAFDLLRTAVAEPGRKQTVIVTSSAPGEGKSTVALGLAEAFARAGRETCLIEADLRRPTLADRLGVPQLGLGEVVRESVDLDEALEEVELGDGASLTVLVAGRRLRRPAEGLRAVAGEVLERLGDRFEAVIVDTPPILAVADAWPLFGHGASVLLCVRVGTTATDELEASRAIVERIAPGRARLVINDARGEAARTVAVPDVPLHVLRGRRRAAGEREPAGSAVH